MYRIITQSSRRVIMALLAVMLTVATVWAEEATTFGGGDGTAKNPYIITTSSHWDQLGTDVSAGTSYSGQYFRLDADISVTTMVGTGTNSNDAKSFSGTFDGNGHSLTVSYTSASDHATAPFRFLSNATVKNLHVDGTITANHKYAAGLAGRTYGTTLIQGCRVSIVINSSFSGDATHGGIVALKPNSSSAKLTIEGCVFDGKIVTSDGTTCCGGFVGYTSYGSLTIRNSIYTPAAPADGETAVSDGSTFYRYPSKNAGTITFENCYYTQTLGNDQGKLAYSISFGPGVDIDIIPTGDATDYGASGIIGYEGNPCVKYNGTVYAGDGDEVKLTFNHNYIGYDVSYSIYKDDKYYTINADVNGICMVTISGADVTLSAQLLPSGGTVVTMDGTKDYPYLIIDTSSWDYFVGLVENGEGNYPTAYYKLVDDISVTTMMGTDEHPFKGHFDGDTHTLTVSYYTNHEYTAPFRYVDGATISNLRVAGSFMTTQKFEGGFIARSKGNTTITNCRSSVTINSGLNGDGTNGGFVAHNTGGTLTIEGCAFDGSMMGTLTNNCAGFVGWNETNNEANGKVRITNCLFAPKGMEQVIDRAFVRSRSYDNGAVTITNSHCTTDYADNQKSRIYSIAGSESVSMTYDATASATYSVSGLTIYPAGLTFDGMLYAKKDDVLTLTLTHTGSEPTGCTFSKFNTTAGELNGSTLEMAASNAIIYATYTFESAAWSGTGDGTSDQPYIIDSAQRWDEFANMVNYGVEGFSTAYYQLTGSFTVTTMVGTDGYKFKGHFDGNSHTLTLNYGKQDAPIEESYCAPFRHVNGAHIHDLNVEGAIYTNKQFAAGIVGFSIGTSSIDKCRVSVAINSNVNGDGTHGGFVANNAGGILTISNSAFNGSMTGSSTNNCGGFVGWTESNNLASVNLTNCLFTPSDLTIGPNGCATFSRGRDSNAGGISLTGCYFTSALGFAQGNLAYATNPSAINIPSVVQSIAGINFYVAKTILGTIAATDITPYQATIGWTGDESISNCRVRYRVRNDNDAQYSYFTDFDEGNPTGWTMIDADNDGENWNYRETIETAPRSGNGCFISESFINNVGPFDPDNWLISPQLTLGGTLQLWLKGQDKKDFREHFAIYLSTTGNSRNNFIDADGNLQGSVITLISETETTNEYQEYTADLTPYSGQQGYIAIRHFNSYNQFYLVLDDFGLYVPNEGGEWTTVPDASPSGTTITGLTPSTFYTVYVQSVKGNKTSEWSKTSFTTLNEGELYLYDKQDNSSVLASYAGKTVNVTLDGRTLYKDGDRNTLCLPFNLTDGDTDPSHSSVSGGRDGIHFTGTPLQGAEVMCFDHASFDPNNGSLEFIFNETFTVPAGEPFLVRWTKADTSDPDLENLINPVFTGVTITQTTNTPNDQTTNYAAFVGTYSPVVFTDEDRSVLFLGGGNTLYYPDGQATTTIGSQRAYFQLKDGLTVGEPTADGSVRAFKLSFGDEATGITDAEAKTIHYTLFTLNSHPGTPSTAAVSTASPKPRDYTSTMAE